MDKIKKIPAQIYLNEDERPKSWYNLRADLKNVEPFLTPDGQPVSKEMLYGIFAKGLVEQEFSDERYIDIPQEVQDKYASFRATPLHRAYGLEKELNTKCRLYYKYEGTNPSGSHKLNSAIPQAYYNKVEGITKLTTETGAGQWGTALAIACNMYDIECEVYMVKCSGLQKPHRRQLIETYGASVYLSPSDRTVAGRAVLAKTPDTSGSLGIAISEAVEVAAADPHANYALGSVLNHVCIHQTIIGLEAKKQLEKIGETPDIVCSCCGGGSNFAGIAFPFVGDKINGKSNIDIVGIEPQACPTLTRGKYAYDFGDIAHLTPMILQYTLGNEFIPPAVHSGGLRYHGMNQLVSKLVHDGYARAVAVTQSNAMEAAMTFAKAETLIIAPESAHTLAYVVDAVKECNEKGEEKVILFNVSGHGILDLKAYDDFLNGKLLDAVYTDEMLEEGFKSIPRVAANDKYLK